MKSRMVKIASPPTKLRCSNALVFVKAFRLKEFHESDSLGSFFSRYHSVDLFRRRNARLESLTHAALFEFLCLRYPKAVTCL